jgi:hypothetical protein
MLILAEAPSPMVIAHFMPLPFSLFSYRRLAQR